MRIDFAAEGRPVERPLSRLERKTGFMFACLDWFASLVLCPGCGAGACLPPAVRLGGCGWGLVRLLGPCVVRGLLVVCALLACVVVRGPLFELSRSCVRACASSVRLV